MERLLREDFSGVRVHADGRAAAAAADVGARAFTTGSQIVFSSGQFAPDSGAGRRLLAHELTHVAQQRRGRTDSGDTTSGIAILDDVALEGEAESRAADVERAPRTPAPAAPLPGTGPAAQLQPQPGWSPGWAKDVAPPMGSAPGPPSTKSTEGFTAGPNAGERRIGAIRRIPVDFLSRGNQEPSPKDRNGQPVSTQESAQGRAIVLIPATFDPSKPADVLLHLHGMNVGYRAVKGQTRDDQVDRIEQQLEASGHHQMIGVLPQGTTKSSFGPKGGFNSDAYLDEVLSTMVFMGVLVDRPRIGRVVLSAHSGGGGPIGQQMLAGKDETSAPSAMREVALFDAINGPRELTGVTEWVIGQLSRDLAALTRPNITPAEQTTYLTTSMRFRAYHSGSASAPADTSKDADYASRHQVLRQSIARWFAANADKLGGARSPLTGALRRNYEVIARPGAGHDQMVAHQNNLQDALGLLPIQRAPLGNNSPLAESGDLIHDALRSPGRPLAEPLRSEMEGRFQHDFGDLRLHAGGVAAASARALDAAAYTVGRHVVFGEHQSPPESAAARRLLTHELTHVVQQQSLPATPDQRSLTIGPVDDSFEREARQASDVHPATRRLQPMTRQAIQRQPATKTEAELRAETCESGHHPVPAAPGDCIYKKPENCATYEQWVSTFTRLKTFRAKATKVGDPSKPPEPDPKAKHVFNVLGGGPAARYPAKPGSANAPAPPATGLRLGEAKFIDHPTDTWVNTCLPENLRATAYQLPSDCADIAIILRHVWLAAHRRTETFGKWTIGERAGKAAQAEVGKIITEVSTANVGQMVNPYSDANGQPLRSFAELEPLLHPGDILVWHHFAQGFDKPRTGGHTHTISGIDRESSTGKIKSISVLQGNLPIFGAEQQPTVADPDDDKGKIIQDLKIKDTPETRKALGVAPGRRIEADKLGPADFGQEQLPPRTKGGQPQTVWKWDPETLLIVAGPAKAAPRPAKQKGSSVRQITDWNGSFASANQATLMGVWEAMLLEARAVVERGGTISEADARSVGDAAGRTVWRLAKAANDLGNVSHFERLRGMRQVLDAVRSSRITTNLNRTLQQINEAFNEAARGGSDVNFGKEAKGKTQKVNLLLTGFDPFNTSDVNAPPRAGEWNPSGAAVMALDDKQLDVGAGVVAAVEGIVLPVDFKEFEGGLVERLVKSRLSETDAVVTVSLAGGTLPSAPVQLERYAVGVHTASKNEPIAPTQGGGAGPAIIESNAPLPEIAAATAGRDKGQPPVSQPTIGEGITMRFPGTDAKQANRALAALGLPATTQPEVIIADAAALRQIITTLPPQMTGPEITFKVGSETFKATLIRGPGGNFLSNEVSYRVLRLLRQTHAARDPLSFHVHTPEGEQIPQDTTTKEARAQKKQSTAGAMKLRTTLIATLQRIIRAVAAQIAKRRKARGSTTP
jgi:hypothetical protein